MFMIAPLQRALIGQAALINPFMNADHAWMCAPTFPQHPHAGLSAISYVFEASETGIDNRDSLGTHHLIRSGDCIGSRRVVAWSIRKTRQRKAGPSTHCRSSWPCPRVRRTPLLLC